MLVKFWESLGEKLADRWLGQVLGPSSFFWIGGLIIWISAFGWENIFAEINQLPLEIKVAIVIVGFLVVFFSASLVQLLIAPTKKILEGNWPHLLSAIRHELVNVQYKKIYRLERRWKELVKKLDEEQFFGLTQEEQDELVQIELQLNKVPGIKSLAPTRLGNIQRGVEYRIEAKYKLDVEIARPRLWLLLPELVRQELSASLSDIDSAVNIFLWGFMFLIWSVWTLWAIPISLLIMVSAYRWTLKAAETYVTVLETCFDLYRFKLYEALGWPLPNNFDDEQRMGKEICTFLRIGRTPDNFKYSR